MWPFVVTEPAKRSSKSRLRGTPVTKPVSVDRRLYLDTLLAKLLPAMRSRFQRNTPIFIQQDNARPHILPTHQQFLAAAQSDGYDFRLQCQPPNSPDMNILELGFFYAIQLIQYPKPTRTLDELITAVLESFNEIEPQSLNFNFLTLQKVLNECMDNDGGNNFKIPHMGKHTLLKAGKFQLPFPVVRNRSSMQRQRS
jgi:hypothetical protein